MSDELSEVFGVNYVDTRCRSLTSKGTRCLRPGTYGHHDFFWCAQHLPQVYRDRQAAREAADTRSKP